MFTKNLILENSLTHSFMYCLWPSHNSRRVEFITVHGLQSLKYLLPSPYRKCAGPLQVPAKLSPHSALKSCIFCFSALSCSVLSLPSSQQSCQNSKLSVFQVLLPLGSLPCSEPESSLSLLFELVYHSVIF